MSATLSTNDLDNQAKLKQVLQDEAKSSKLEHLAAALLGRLLGVPIAIAKSGFQHGGDAGPAGRQGRRFRVESKKYSDTTSLSDRELLGEIDHALSRDKALEAWILIATREVSEQLELDLTQKGDAMGVPVIIIDWKGRGLASLAALCAFDPDVVEEIFSTEAGKYARLLQPVSGDAIEQIRRNLQSWNLGFDSLRTKSHAKLTDIWGSPRVSNSQLGQNAAGGAQPKKVKRRRVHGLLDKWWSGKAQSDAPLAIVGWDGVGKTWAALDWLVDKRDDQPIILIIPSSTTAELTGISETTVKRFLADRLYEFGGKRDLAHWQRRLDYLLSRPLEEGPVLTIFFDGLNQEPSVSWLLLLKVLQGPAFEGKVRVIVSTRNHHLNEKLSKLRGLVVPPVFVPVDVYDTDANGELDQMLEFEGLTQADLHSDLIELARTPRLFKLVVRFRERLVEAGQVTIHRLLWEYGRDTFGERAGRSFSEDEWTEWLKEIARTYREGVRNFSVKELSETASRPDLTEGDVFARLSDIIDGRFAQTGSSGKLQLSPTVVSHALGVALLSHLAAATTQTFDAIDAELSQWLDPIAGLDQRAEILRAAVSIYLERGEPTFSPVAGVLVTAWLQTQNIPDQHRQELMALAAQLSNPLIDVIEHSTDSVNASARSWAVKALRAIPRSDMTSLETIINRTKNWFLTVSRDIHFSQGESVDLENHRAQHYIKRVGVDAAGPLTVLGLPLQFVDRDGGILSETAALILEGFPLASAISIFEVVAVAQAVARRNDSWNSIKWLILLNEVDPEETTTALRKLSAAVRSRSPEPGINSDLPARVAALLLWLTGFESDDEAANQLNPLLDRPLTYEKDYLVDPGRSFFVLERRHAEAVLLDTDLEFHIRIQRTEELWLDPNFEPPVAFVAEVKAQAAHVDVEKLNRQMGNTIEDHQFEKFEPVLARCAPGLLADIVRRKLQSFGTRPPASRYMSAAHATDQFVLVDSNEATPARALRLSTRENDEGNECFAASRLLILEIWNLSAAEQMTALLEADLKYISTDLTQVMKVPTSEEVAILHTRFGQGTAKQQNDLLILLSIHSVALDDTVWAWVENFACGADNDYRGLAFRMLAQVDATRFGRVLMSLNWAWSADKHVWENHYGSGALIEATLAHPFDQIAVLLAPWRLLEAARRRGSDPVEVRLAAGIFGHALAAEKLEEFDPGSILSVDRARERDEPFSYSIQPRSNGDQASSPGEELRASFDLEAIRVAHQRAADTAIQRVQGARRAGANLYLANVDKEDFKIVLKHAPDLVDGWLEGMAELTADFKRRTRLAEAAYLSLCEALLAHDPDRGAALWRALRQTITTRFIGAAGVEEFIHIAFRAPDSSAVTGIRDELYSLNLSNSDESLYNLAIAAAFNEKTDWFKHQIASDEASDLAWRRKRSIVMSGFISNNTLPVKDAWPDGPVLSSHAGLIRQSARRRWIEACSYHWWRSFLAATDSVGAYAAWVLFLRSADRRAWVWLREDASTRKDADQLVQLKQAHAELNRHNLNREIKKRLNKLDKQFLDRKIVEGIGPWGEIDFS